MAGKGGSAGAWLLIDGYNLSSSSFKGFSYKVAPEQEDTTGIGDTIKQGTPTGVTAVSLNVNQGFFDTSALGGHIALKDVATSPQGTERIICVGVMGQTHSEPFAGFAGAHNVEYEVLGQGAKLTKANTKHAIVGAREEGVILHALAARTANHNGTSHDNAAQSTAGASAYLQVTDYSGFTSVAFKIQDSTDNSAWNDKSPAFTNVTSRGGQRIAITGTIARYTRVVATVTGTGSITFFAGIARGAA